ncbi:hypothetical protein B0H67DRAFT_646492 [Lasiosphaeris hirsuta]|uniref:PHD-type domain-containing protein n=1 Tax=Lasiosphaeris hirsuta TaxID=260670 RepID=A0AA40A8E9_9PEZI|nr:hypothetical protein B0H67DRAFT_646492 [Lasiosphaeris hirsuta]
MAADGGRGLDEALSPQQNAPSIEQAAQSIGSIKNHDTLNQLNMRADPDAQTTVNDFLDFTEFLPADMMRSLTLIGQLDKNYIQASSRVHELTTKWGQLPSIPPAERAGPVELRAQVSENLVHGVHSRIYAHAEAVRMAENLNRHFNRAKFILAKMETTYDNYPTAEELERKSPVATAKSPQLSRAPQTTLRVDSQRIRRPRVPRITVPGEVLAPYDLNYEIYSSDSESSSDEEEDEQEVQPTSRITPGPQRIKVVKTAPRPPKPSKVPKSGTSVPPPNFPGAGISTSAALAQHKPPPENVVIGSADAPWGQLTPYELARLRKRMKKNAAWAPSDTMVARELSNLGRGIEAFKAAKQKAEEEGRPFEGRMPVPILDPETGDERMPLGALTVEALATDEKNLSNRGMRLNEAKKAKRKALADLAAEEAEESAKKFRSLVESLISNGSQPQPQPPLPDQATKVASKAKPPKKRKRDSVAEADADKPKASDGLAQRPQVKRTKTETPVPPPQLNPGISQASLESVVQRAAAPTAVLHSTTPIPLPSHGQDHSITAKSSTPVLSSTSPTPSSNAGQFGTTTATPSVKLPTSETPIPPPIHSPKKSTTPIFPPVRETRKTQAARTQEQQKETTQIVPVAAKSPSHAPSPAPLTPKLDPEDPQQQTASSSSATAAAPLASTANAAVSAPTTTTTVTRRPPSRGKAASQEPQPSIAADRPRRASTARNTPAPERPDTSPGVSASGGGFGAAGGAGAGAGATVARPSSRRAKRPAPGIISRTVSGGNSAVGKRKAAPKKKSARGGKVNRDSKGGTVVEAAGTGGGETFEVEVDDEGNVIDPDEPKYCLCNRVSFGTMIQCDNADNCKQEWFHLECLDMIDLPARTTKWYCPDCRILLNIGEKGEVTARGVKA